MTSCRLCSSRKTKEQKVRDGLKVIHCHNCGVEFLKDFPRKTALEKFYKTRDYYQFWGNLDRESIEQVEQLKRATAERVFDLVRQYKGKGNFLDVGCATGVFLEVAKKKRWKTYGVEMSIDFISSPV